MQLVTSTFATNTFKGGQVLSVINPVLHGDLAADLNNEPTKYVQTILQDPYLTDTFEGGQVLPVEEPVLEGDLAVDGVGVVPVRKQLLATRQRMITFNIVDNRNSILKYKENKFEYFSPLC